MAAEVRDATAALITYDRQKVSFRIVARPTAQIIDDVGNVIIEGVNEWEIRELYRLIKGEAV